VGHVVAVVCHFLAVITEGCHRGSIVPDTREKEKT
jgi:hypothetical protein